MGINAPLKYSGRSSKYLLPVFRPDSGDGGSVPRVSARSEQRYANICDIQLLGNNRALLGETYKSCVLEEGDYSVSGNTISLTSIKAYIKGFYVANRGKALSWVVPSGVAYNLYIGIIEIPKDIMTADYFSTSEYGDIRTATAAVSGTQPNDNYIILAQVTI